MATYFHNGAGSTSSDIHSSAAADHGLQTLYLMNPNNYVPNYSQDAAHHPMPNMLLLNPTNALNLSNLSHAPPQHVINNGVTVNPTSNILRSPNPDDPTLTRSSFLGQQDHIAGFHGFTATAAPRVHYNLSRSVIDQTPSAVAATPGDDDSPQMSNFQRPAQQGLSLSLSSQQQTVYKYNRSLSGGDLEVAAMSPTSRAGGDDIRSIIVGSKYLKAAQVLLDEVVNVVGGKGIYKWDESSIEGANKKQKIKVNAESTCGNIVEISSGGGGENSATKQGVELSTPQRQELQMKKSKLVNMLDEVEQRYRQYHHQMQIVISSFEGAARFGAAKSYTGLALKTISKQFRCLKDAISSQIRETSKSLGEEDHCLGAKLEGSRLRYVDHHPRQQRVLEHLGMMQHNAWRPQRGLPERAVSVLRAWLFEHFLYPYPKDSDKVMLAKQTGLTRSQVSNWFINARVRLWKPMVEEMYLEEMKEQEKNNDDLWSAANNNNNNASMESDGVIRVDQIKLVQSSKAETSLINNPQKDSPTVLEISNSSLSKPSLQSQSSVLTVDMEMKPGETITTRNIKFEAERPNNHGEDGGGGYINNGAFSLEDIGRFNFTSSEQLAPRFHGNGVSLSLGLPHTQSENLNPLSARNNVHLGMRLEMGANINGNDLFYAINNTTTPPPSSSHSSTSYESSIDIQNRKRFAAQFMA